VRDASVKSVRASPVSRKATQSAMLSQYRALPNICGWLRRHHRILLRPKLLAVGIYQDTGLAHAAGGETLDGALRLDCLCQPQEDFCDGLPKLLRMILGKAGLWDMGGRRLGGFSQYATPEIDGDGPDPARAKIEASKQRCATQC
jgi:hypothetical protein